MCCEFLNPYNDFLSRAHSYKKVVATFKKQPVKHISQNTQLTIGHRACNQSLKLLLW